MPNTFEELLKEYTIINPKPGQIVDGEVVAITDETVILDVGAKQDAIVPKQELSQLSETTLQELFIGHQLPVFITRTSNANNELLVSIEKGLAQQDWDRAAQYLESKETLEFEVIDTNAGGILVDFGRISGFVPNSLIPGLMQRLHEAARQKAKQEYIGKTLKLNVIEVDQARKRLILSGKAAETARRKERLQELQIGQKITGIVSNVVDFGAFVNLGSIDGLIHISRLSWEKVEHPSNVVKPGDEIEVLIKNVDVDRERVSLDRRALLPSPWDEFAKTHHSGDILEGTIDSVANFGAFVKLTGTITGLVHSSELPPGIAHDPTESIKVGDKALVRILEIDTERQRVRLSMRRVPMEDFSQWMLENHDYAIQAPQENEEVLPDVESEVLSNPPQEAEVPIPDEVILASEPLLKDQE
jgi:small subunit ribosomal protein S1